ncbi:hypothetical protein FQ085_14935 [Planococcus sp. ANT_H30]|uniref:putative phage abortive infection protein n=1 Tax=Planococcus sp. ANT_H30 TaxID=2597347 RepID=UPI0011ECA01B|nr:putative phage abortive infection protein [Planococcus sp. ANT_H30]KAA0956136.1 hypothetical protein FQ085_14935 [Planococcus sp. ANT_H30]
MELNFILLSIILVSGIFILKILSFKKVPRFVFMGLITSGLLFGGALSYFVMVLLNYNPEVGKDSSRLDDILRISIPLLGSLITAFSLVIASKNTANNEESSKRQGILELIKFTTDIINDHEIMKESNTLIANLEKNLASSSTKVDMLVNRGAGFVFDYLTRNNEENRNEILEKLEKNLSFDEGSELDKEKNGLIQLIKSNEIKDMRSLWITINHLSGKPSINYGILNETHVYKLNADWIGRGLKRHYFYSKTILNRNRNILTELIQENSKQDFNDSFITYDDVYRVCDSTFDGQYPKLGHFFRTTHRTIKLINQHFSNDIEEHRQHIGLLRAQIPDEIAVLLFYNAFYSERGLGMGIEMISSNFFGDLHDFKFDKSKMPIYKLKSSQHFQTNGMSLADQNSYVICKLFTQNDESIKFKNDFLKAKRNNDRNFFYSQNIPFKEPINILESTKLKFLGFLPFKKIDPPYLIKELDLRTDGPNLLLVNKFREVFFENSTRYYKDDFEKYNI